LPPILNPSPTRWEGGFFPFPPLGVGEGARGWGAVEQPLSVNCSPLPECGVGSAPPRTQLDDDEDNDHAEEQIVGLHEIARPKLGGVISQEGRPTMVAMLQRGWCCICRM